MILNLTILLVMNFQFGFVHSNSNKNVDGVTFQLPWRSIKRLKSNLRREQYGETTHSLRLPIYIRYYIYSSWADISTMGLPNSYRVHGHTSHSWDNPTLMSSNTQLRHGFVQIWLICRHTSHLWDFPQLQYEILFNIMNELTSWYCLLSIYNTIISSFDIVL